MELWIRTQDKRKLINVKNLVIETGRPTIYTCEGMGSVIYQEVLGTYKTKRRALEILDEIQDLLKSKALIKTVDNNPPIGDLVNLKEQIEIRTTFEFSNFVKTKSSSLIYVFKKQVMILVKYIKPINT